MREIHLQTQTFTRTATAVVGAVLLAAAGGWWSVRSASGPAPSTRATADAPDRPSSSPRTSTERRTPKSPDWSLPGQQDGEKERAQYDPAVLRIVTNFVKADATINGLPYPEYTEPGGQPGMVVPAGGPYKVEVNYNGNTKTYTLSLKPYEVRYLMVELSGFQGASQAPTPSRSPPEDSADREASNQNQSGKGRVTVYSKPKGAIHVDGQAKDQQTPGTVKVASGEHDIQVNFKNGEMSESKTVRVRKGSRIKLFFRKNEGE